MQQFAVLRHAVRLVARDNYMIQHNDADALHPVSYTHLTLPTNSRV